MKPLGSGPWYDQPGRRLAQFGVRRWRDSQQLVRQLSARWPRSSTTCSTDRSVRQRLTARPAWPAPMTRVWTVGMERSWGADRRRPAGTEPAGWGGWGGGWGEVEVVEPPAGLRQAGWRSAGRSAGR